MSQNISIESAENGFIVKLVETSPTGYVGNSPFGERNKTTTWVCADVDALLERIKKMASD